MIPNGQDVIPRGKSSPRLLYGATGSSSFSKDRLYPRAVLMNRVASPYFHNMSSRKLLICVYLFLRKAFRFVTCVACITSQVWSKPCDRAGAAVNEPGQAAGEQLPPALPQKRHAADTSLKSEPINILFVFLWVENISVSFWLLLICWMQIAITEPICDFNLRTQVFSKEERTREPGLQTLCRS